MSEGSEYYIGWDVGAWKCTAGRSESCDALVVLGESGIVGHYRNNMSGLLGDLPTNPAKDRVEAFINECFSRCCEAQSLRYSEADEYTIAIDTPLGWPNHFRTLLGGALPGRWSYRHRDPDNSNTFLYRYTEREKLGGGLSAIVQSIGGQSVKGLVLLQLLQAEQVHWGVWQVANIRLIETYPKACLVRPNFVEWMRNLNMDQSLAKTFQTEASKNPKTYRDIRVIAEDSFDAGVCACVAKAYASGQPPLVSPSGGDPVEYVPEGWVFFPDEPPSGVTQSIADGHSAATCREGIETFHEAIGEFQEFIRSKVAEGKK